VLKALLASIVLSLLGGVRLFAQANTTAATAANVPWGQSFLASVNGASQFWYRLHVESPRSYCVETGQPDHSFFADKVVRTDLTVYRTDGTTEITTNGGFAAEPVNGALVLSRACFVAPFGGNDVFVKIFGLPTYPAASPRIRFVETTLFCPWFFVAGDYNAFSLIRNTSDSELSGVVVTWNGLNGAQAGTTIVSIPPDGTVILNARDFVNPATFSNGSITIAHPGSPEQLIASTTTLSATTGLGFDAVFTQREPW